MQSATGTTTLPGPHLSSNVEESTTLSSTTHSNSNVVERVATSRATHPAPHQNSGAAESATTSPTPHPDIHPNSNVTEPTTTSPPNARVAESATTSPMAHPGPHQNEPLQYAPWLAIASLLIVLMCMGASAGIIVLSDRRIAASWKIQPAVLLSILSSVSNFALGIAFSTSVTVTWWRSAERGTSLARLHYIWVRGQIPRFFSALSAGYDAREVVLATAFVAIVQIGSGPLLQRATHTRVETTVTPQAILLNITPLLPEGWIATVVDASVGSLSGSRNGLATAQAWWRNATVTSLNAPGYFCNGTCEGAVQGAGIGYDCSSTTRPLDLSTGAGTVIFSINYTMAQNATGAPILVLTTLYSSAIDDSCIATITTDTCYIEAGVVEYPVTIQDSTVALNYDELNNVTMLSTYTYPGDLPTAPPHTGAGTLQGLRNFYGYYLSTSTTVLNDAHYSGNSMLADMFFQTDPSSYDNYTFMYCGLKWSSPTEYVLNSMQDFMFRAAIRASDSSEIQTFTAQRTSSVLVFFSEYNFLAAALAAMLFAVFVVLYMLRGWWNLGRTVSLSPLETARAFFAPIMQRDGLGSTADEILDDIGRVLVRYTDGSMMVYGFGEQRTGQRDEELGQLPESEAESQTGQAGVEFFPLSTTSSSQTRPRTDPAHHRFPLSFQS